MHTYIQPMVVVFQQETYNALPTAAAVSTQACKAVRMARKQILTCLLLSVPYGLDCIEKRREGF